MWPRPVARRKRRMAGALAGVVRYEGDWMSPVVDSFIWARCGAKRWHSRSRWWEVYRSRPHGHGSAVLFGGGSVGDRLQNTRNVARVSAQSTPCRWVGNVNEGWESGSSVFHLWTSVKVFPIAFLFCRVFTGNKRGKKSERDV